MPYVIRAVCAATLAVAVVSDRAWSQAAPSQSTTTASQNATTALPRIDVRSKRTQSKKKNRAATPAISTPAAPTTGPASLTVPTTAQATT
jgi:hypothetical protein